MPVGAPAAAEVAGGRCCPRWRTGGGGNGELTWTGAPPALPPIGECVDLGPWRGTVAPDGTAGYAGQIRMLFDPAVIGWAGHEPSGLPEMRGYFGLREDRDPDALLLALAVDGLPPVVFGLGATGWAPTVELTMHMRMVPAPGPLRVAARSTARQRRLVRRGGRGLGRGGQPGRAEPPDRPSRPRSGPRRAAVSAATERS